MTLSKFFSGILFLVFFSGVSQAQTLKQVFEAAKSYSASMKDKRLAVEQAEEEKSKAYSTVLPTVSANSSNVWRDQANVGAFGEGYQRTSWLNLSQPLFQGGAEYHALGIARRYPEIARLEKVTGELQLYEEVAAGFYELLRLVRQETIYSEQIMTLEKRVSTLKNRARIGRNKKTDVLAAESQLARTRAEAVRVESQLVAAANTLSNLTGLESFQLKDPVDVKKLVVGTAWQENLQSVPYLKAAELSLEVAKKEVSVVKANFLPSIDLDGNYYLERAGILQESDWDVTVTATWELISGGEDLSEKRIQALEVQRLEAQLQQDRRHITKDFVALKRELEVRKDMVSKLKSAVELSKRNYEQHVREANQGLVSQLDVLRVLEDYLQVRQTYDQELFNVKRTWVKLQVLAGVLP